MNTNSEKPFFSIIIPTYNHGHLISGCLESVIKQTFKSWEAIIVNNYSPDNTIDVINSFGDNRFKLHNFSNNGIIAASRNKGIRESSGKWVCFLDSDDCWYPEKLQSVYDKIMSQETTDAFCHDMYIVSPNKSKKRLMPCGPTSSKQYMSLLLFGNVFITSALAVKKSLLIKHNIYFNESKEFVTVEDYDFCLQLALNEAFFFCINKPLGEYLSADQNISKQQFHFVCLEQLLRYHVYCKQSFTSEKNRLWKKVKAQLFFLKGANFLGETKFLHALNNWTSSFICSPFVFLSLIVSKVRLNIKRIAALIRQQ